MLLHLRQQRAPRAVRGLRADGRADDPPRVVKVHASVHEASRDETVRSRLRGVRAPHRGGKRSFAATALPARGMSVDWLE